MSAHIPSLYAVLDLVRARPSMYVGWSETERGRQLDGLDMLIAGYTLAAHHHGVTDPGLGSYARFPEYLSSKYGWSMSCGPIAAIREATPSDVDPWDRFWQLLAEFRHADELQP